MWICKAVPFKHCNGHSGGRQGLFTPFCRRTNWSPGSLPPVTPRFLPLLALCLVMCMEWGGGMAPAQPQDKTLAHSPPQLQPRLLHCPRPSKGLIVPGKCQSGSSSMNT